MNIEQLRCHIINKRLKNETYEDIADELGINKSLVYYIETHEKYRPSRHIRKLLGLIPDTNYTSIRREKLNELARDWGYDGWCNYETEMIRRWKSEQIPCSKDRS